MLKNINSFILIFSLLFNIDLLTSNHNPKISIITILNEDSDNFIEKFFEDIKKQTIFNESELILINNGSLLQKEAIINLNKKNHENIHYFHLKNKLNRYLVLNLGISKSKSNYIINLNVEDRFDHKLLELYYNELENNLEIDLVYSGYYITYNANETFEKNNYRWFVDPAEFNILNMQKYLPGPAPMWRKEIHKKYGFFDSNYQYCSNWQMWLRCISKGSKFKKVNGKYTLYYHKESTPEEKEIQISENNKIAQKYEYLWKNIQSDYPFVKDKFFVVIIPSYNNKYWYQRNLNSVFMQNYQNYKVIYIDDDSTDKTSELVENYIKFFDKTDKVRLIKNNERKGALENFYNAIHSCKPEDIIVTLDGDDWFANENVLSYLNKIYQNPNIWLTYGQFVYYPNNAPGWANQIPQEIIDQNKFRDHDWRSTHLRTFYAGLFQQIKKSDLMLDNKFFTMAWDLAFMFPMLEMAGNKSKFISEILYIYNVATNLNDHKIDPNLQFKLTQIIRNKEKYKPIENFLSEKKENKKIYIYADQWNSLFDINDKIANRDDILEPFYKLKKNFEDITIDLIHTKTLENLDDADLIVLFNFNPNVIDLIKWPKEKLILFLWEPETTNAQNYETNYHDYFSKIYTWNDDLVDNKKYFKFYYPFLNQMTDNYIEFEKKKLCTMICMNKHSSNKNELYSEREKIINFFEQTNNNDFDFYGMYWKKEKYKNYKGKINNKVNILKHYKFCICYENTKNCKGYVSEKIFDCFRAGCVPIYLGAPNISEYIPTNCYISRQDFDSNEALYLYLKNISKTDYEKYISNIKKYLSSLEAQLFSTETFIKIFKKACNIK